MFQSFFRDKNAPPQLSRELHNLIENIGETKTKQQEVTIIKQEIQKVKIKLQGNLDAKDYPDIMVKLIYFETLGYNTNFAKILPINLCQTSGMYLKKISYLLSAMLVRPGQKLAILMHNTIIKDLQSDNVYIVLTVLTMLRYFLNQDLITDTLQIIKGHLKNKMGMVRRKALFVVYNIYQRYPHLIENIGDITISMLSDNDIPVVFGAVSVLKWLVMQDHIKYKSLVPKLTQILQKIIDHKYPHEYDYHKVPAPWFQLDILQMLQKLGKNDPTTSAKIYDTLEKCMRRSQNMHMIFHKSILQQCIKTASSIYPHEYLLEESCKSLDVFFQDGNNNLKSFGLTAMTYLAKIKPEVLQKWQYFLIECLQSEDITLSERTINLLIGIANESNTQVILNKIIGLAERSTDPVDKRKLIINGMYLIQRFSDEKQIFLRRMNEIFYKFQEFVSEASLNNYLRTLLEMIELDPDFSDMLITTYIEILENFRNTVLVKVSVWIIGEVCHKLYLRDKNSEIVDEAVTAILSCAGQYLNNSSLLFYIVVSLMKLSPIEMTSKSDEIKEFLFKVESSHNFSIFKIGEQFIRLAKYGRALYNSNQLQFDPNMRFLSHYVEQNYEPPNKDFVISKKKTIRSQEDDLDLLMSESHPRESKNTNIFQFKTGHRWGQQPSNNNKKQEAQQFSSVSLGPTENEKRIVLRGPHQNKKAKNPVDAKKAMLAKSIFGLKK